MKGIKSWVIILIGIVIQLLIGGWELWNLLANTTQDIKEDVVGVAIITIGLVFVAPAIAALLPLLLLLVEKTRRAGAIAALLLGLIELSILGGVWTGMITAVALLAAGVVELRKGKGGEVA